jgi:hypothetical protein
MLYNLQRDEYSESIQSTVSQHCRLKYSSLFPFVPHHSPEWSKMLNLTLKEHANISDGQKRELKADVLPYLSGSVIIPLEYGPEWSSDKMIMHSCSRLTGVIEEIFMEYEETLGEVLFGVAHHEVKGFQID